MKKERGQERIYSLITNILLRLGQKKETMQEGDMIFIITKTLWNPFPLQNPEAFS